MALLRAGEAIDSISIDSEAMIGVKLVKNALDAPLAWIAENAGREGAVVVAGVRKVQKERGDANVGFEVVTGEYVDLLENGIIDPLKVTRAALENAASVAALLLTTEALIVEIPQNEQMPAMPPMDDY